MGDAHAMPTLRPACLPPPPPGQVSLKGGVDGWAVNTSNPTLNQNAITFVKQAPPPPRPRQTWAQWAVELADSSVATGAHGRGHSGGPEGCGLGRLGLLGLQGARPACVVALQGPRPRL